MTWSMKKRPILARFSQIGRWDFEFRRNRNPTVGSRDLYRKLGEAGVQCGDATALAYFVGNKSDPSAPGMERILQAPDRPRECPLPGTPSRSVGKLERLLLMTNPGMRSRLVHLLRFLPLRPSPGCGWIRAAGQWTLVFGRIALLSTLAAGERAAAADRQLLQSEIEAWFSSSLKTGTGQLLPIRTKNHVTEFIDGTDTFQAMHRRLKGISGKNSYIYLLNWWIDDTLPLVEGDPNSTLRAVLSKASESRVQIRGMFWAQKTGQNKEQNKFINGLAYGGSILDNKTRLAGSHHQKVLILYDGADGVVDPLVAFCGGIDFNRDRLYANGVNGSAQVGAPDHDVHCMVQGPAAWDLLRIFVNRWNDHPYRLNLPTSPINKQGLFGNNSPSFASTINPGHNEWVQIGHTFPPPGIDASLGYGFAPRGEQSAKGIILHAIAHAKNYIYFEDQYMVSPEAREALADALAKNLKLRLIVLVPDWPITYPPNLMRTHRAEFLARLNAVAKGRVEVYVLDTPNHEHTYVHAKVWIFDDEFAVIGSANCNSRSWTYDSEVVAGICDPGNGIITRMPHRLRKRLWSEHLHVREDSLDDWSSAIALWSKPPDGSHIKPYDAFNPGPGAKPPRVQQNLEGFWNKFIDPDAGPVTP